MSSDLFSQYPETAVLSLVLQNGDLIDEVRDIKVAMFSSIPNRSLFDFLLGIRNEGLMPDYGLVVAKLQERGKLNDCGGESYLKFLFSQSFDKTNVKEFSSYVVNAYKARQVLTLSSSVPGMVTDISSIDNVIGSLRTSLDDLSMGTGDSVSTITEATKQAWEDLVKRINNPNKIEYTTGVPKLDAVTGGYWPEDVWVIAGRPGMGKTSFMCNSILTGVPSLIFSLEMSKQSLIYRMVSILSGVSIFDIRLAQLKQSELDRISEALKILNTLPIYIDTSYVNSIDSVLSTIRKYHRMYGTQIVHIDYLQLLAERTSDATNELGRISRSMKLLARDLGITSVLYSQLNRNVESRGEDKRPLLSDLRQSGNIEEDADVAVFLYRDEVYNPETKYKNVMEFLVRKQRNGPTGVVTSTFNDQTNRILDKE